MRSTSYLQNLSGRWYVRVKVPRILQGRLRNTHVRRALGTSDLSEANRRKWSVIARIQSELERLKRDHEGLTGDRQTAANLPSHGAAEVAGIVLPTRMTRSSTRELTTLDPLVDRWLSATDYLQQTKQQHRQAYGELRSFLGGDRPLNHVTPQIAVEFVEERLKQSGQSYSTKRRKLNSLMSLWEWLELQRLLPRGANPWRGFKLATKRSASIPARRKRPYTDAELVRLFAEPPVYPGLGDVMTLGLLTGMRLEEICALRIEDVQPDAEGGFWLNVRKAKTRAGVREVLVSHRLGAATVARRWQHNAEGQLFPELRGGGYDLKLSWAVSKAFGRHRNRCGLSGETDFHSFRRTFITLMENSGVDQVRIARYVGHELPTLAFAVYSGGSSAITARETARAVEYPSSIEQVVARFVAALKDS